MYVEYIETLLEEAMRAADAGDYKMAENLMKNALYDEPGYSKIHNNLGWLYQYCMHNKDLAEVHLKYAIKFDPSNESAYYNIINLLIDKGNYHELREVLEGALKYKKNNASLIYMGIGKTYEAEKSFKKALYYYKKSLYETVDNYDADDLKDSIKRIRYKRLKKIW